jgi:hypothetical protein
METAEILNADIPKLARRKPEARSRVGNGKTLLPMSDGRSATARRFRDIYEDVAADLGGLDFLSEGQKQLIRRAALLSAECERQESLAARGERLPNGEIMWKENADFLFDIDRYVVMTNSLRRVLETIGLKRVPRPVNDGSQALVDYFSRPPPPEGAAP